MKDQPITVEDYKEHSQEFFDKYFYVAKELGEDAKTEDILRCMEAIGGVALKVALEEKSAGPFGFNKVKEGEGDDGTEKTDTSIDAGS